MEPEASRARRRARQSFWAAWTLWALTVGLGGGAIGYGLSHPAKAVAGAQDVGANSEIGVAFILAFATVGALLAWKRSENPIGWLLGGTGLCYAVAGAGAALANFPGTARLSQWLGWVWLVGIAVAIFVILLFPTGSVPSPRWRPVAWAVGLGMCLWILGNAFAPTILSADQPSIANPTAAPGPVGRAFAVLAGLGLGLIALAGLAAIGSVAVRYRHARSIEREQLKWLMYAVTLIVAAQLVNAVVGTVVHPHATAITIENAVLSAAVALVPVAVGVAIFRYRLYDIDLVISKTLVYGSLAFFITGVYVAIVVGVGSLVQQVARPSPGLSIVATAIVAVAFHPVRERVQAVANWLVFGKRATPYELLTELSERMTGTMATDDLLRQMAQIMAEGTGAVRADVWLRVGDEFRNSAAWPPAALRAPPVRASAGMLPPVEPADQIRIVRHRGEVLGALSVRKRPGESLTGTEERMFSDLAAQTGIVLRNLGLTDELLERLAEVRASRQRLVAAQDEERRRIERNIHDGAQQQLVALAIKLRLTESLIGVDSDGERELLAELSADAKDAIENLRDLARGIYPPLLAERGLIAALAAQVAKAPLPVRIDAAGVGRLPAETEAGLYFCVLEAVQNAVKYAGASRIKIAVSQARDDVAFEVADDGVGFDPDGTSTGTGLLGIGDRLAALGGTLEVRSAPGAGTSVRGVISVRMPASAR